MDPVTAAVVAAIAVGASTGLGETATQVVKDAYAGLKGLIAGKYGGVDVSAVEKKPDSEPKKASLAEDLEDAGAAGDVELGAAAAAVLEAVREQVPQAVVGVNVEGLVSGVLNITDVESTGDGVRVRNARIGGEVNIGGVRAGFTESPGPSAARD